MGDSNQPQPSVAGAYRNVGERRWVEGIPFGYWLETGDCYISTGPLREGDTDLLAEIDEYAELLDRLSGILTRTANALKGDPGPLKLHDWSDLSEVAKRLVDQAPVTQLEE